MLKNLIINNYKWIIFFICLLLFFALAEDVFNHDIMNGDVIGYKFVSTYLIHDSITGFVKMITWCGSATCLILLTIVLFAFIKNKKTGILIGTNLVIITILNQIFKFILQRPRPTEFRIIDETGYSFPSGHSSTTMCFYGILIYLVLHYAKSDFWRYFLTILFGGWIFMVGISRLWLGVHYPVDVIAGMFLGFLLVNLYIIISKSLSK